MTRSLELIQDGVWAFLGTLHHTGVNSALSSSRENVQGWTEGQVGELIQSTSGTIANVFSQLSFFVLERLI